MLEGWPFAAFLYVGKFYKALKTLISLSFVRSAVYLLASLQTTLLVCIVYRCKSRVHDCFYLAARKEKTAWLLATGLSGALATWLRTLLANEIEFPFMGASLAKLIGAALEAAATLADGMTARAEQCVVHTHDERDWMVEGARVVLWI